MPQATVSLQGNSAEVIVETSEWISGGSVSQPLLSDFASAPVAFHDVSAIFAGGAAASLASAQSIGMWTNDVPGANGSYVQEAFGAIHPAYDSQSGRGRLLGLVAQQRAHQRRLLFLTRDAFYSLMAIPALSGRFSQDGPPGPSTSDRKIGVAYIG
jgi:hypothetical protein